MSFERYEQRGRPPLNPAIVRIERAGTIGVNMSGWRAMGEPKYAELWFDRTRRLIGIKPVKERSALSFVVVKPRAASTVRIAARQYLRDYGIDHTVTRRYPAEFTGGFLVVDINKPEAISERAKVPAAPETDRQAS